MMLYVTATHSHIATKVGAARCLNHSKDIGPRHIALGQCLPEELPVFRNYDLAVSRKSVGIVCQHTRGNLAMTMLSPGLVNEQQATLPAAHHVPIAGLLHHFSLNPECGLTQEQAEERLSRLGPNVLPMAAPRSAWLKFIDQFKSLLIIVLGGAAALAALVGNLKDAAVIIAAPKPESNAL